MSETGKHVNLGIDLKTIYLHICAFYPPTNFIYFLQLLQLKNQQYRQFQSIPSLVPQIRVQKTQCLKTKITTVTSKAIVAA